SLGARARTSSPASSREGRMDSAPFEQIVGGRDGRVEGVHRAVALAYQRGARELVLVAVGIQLRQLARALKARERRYRQREVMAEPIAAPVRQPPDPPPPSHYPPIHHPALPSA